RPRRAGRGTKGDERRGPRERSCRPPRRRSGRRGTFRDPLSLSERRIDQIRREFPRFRLVPKAGDPLSRVIALALRAVTLGRQRYYLSHYHTVLGYTLYVPESWGSTSDVDREILLRHERVHLLQRRRYGFGLMALLYLLPFFPLGLAYGRARLEWEA